MVMWGFPRLTKTPIELPMRRKNQKPFFSGQHMYLNNIAMSKLVNELIIEYR